MAKRKYAERGGPVMQTNNLSKGFISEDWGAPALCPRGVHEITVSAATKNHRSGRLGDLYEQVDKTTRADQNAFDSITDPTNW